MKYLILFQPGSSEALNVEGEDIDDDFGPDLSTIMDRDLTLTPDVHPPTEDTEGVDLPPDLPPKASRRQNGMLPQGDNKTPPPELPPRRERDSKMGTVCVLFLVCQFKISFGHG